MTRRSLFSTIAAVLAAPFAAKAAPVRHPPVALYEAGLLTFNQVRKLDVDAIARAYQIPKRLIVSIDPKTNRFH